MKKSKIVLISCASVAGVIALAGVAVSVLGFSAASEAGENAASSGKKLRKIFDDDPFPNAANIATAKTNVARRTSWTQSLAKALDEGSLPAARNVSPGIFSQMREKAIERMTAAAPKAEGGAAALPENFAFGFERYSSGVPAEKQHVERLVRQLQLMEKLVGVIYGAGIGRLEAVGREAFEDATGEEDEDYGSSRRRRGGAGVSGNGSISIPPQPAIGGAVPLQRDRFAFQFTAKESALVAILNSLSAMHPYAMVTSLSVEKVGSEVFFPEEAAAEAGSSGDEDTGRRRRRRRGGGEDEQSAPGAAATTVLNERPAPRSSRLVSGPLREVPVRVFIVVDVCSVPSAGGAADESVAEED